MKHVSLVIVLLITACSEKSAELTVAIGDQHRNAANEHADLNKLKSALDSITSFHKKNNTGLTLRPGLNDSQFEIVSKQFPCKIPAELRALWQWRDGESTEKFIWYHRFLPTDIVAKQYKELTSSMLMQWPNNWIPVFEFEGEWYAVECGKHEQQGTPVIHYFIEDLPKVAYTNFTTFMTVMAAAMEQGALRWEKDWWQDDIQALAKIHGQFNNSIPFPYHVAIDVGS